MKKYINKKTIIIGLLFMSLLGFFLLKNHSSGNNKAEEEPEATVSDVITLTPDAIKGVGISTLTVFEKPLVSQIVTTGEIKTNEDKRFTINSIVTGRIIQDRVKLGDYIRQGETVAIIQNPEVTQINANSTQQLHENRISIRQAQTRYTLAKMNYEREKKLFKEGISPQKDYIQAQSDMIIAQEELANVKEKSVHIKSEARAMLGTYGVSANLNSEGLITSSPITALRSGVITKKNITVGSVVSPDQILYEVSDLKQLWLDITLYAKDIAKIKDGQTVVFKSESFPTQQFIGKIDYIQPASNEPTQTFIARAFINNPLGLLKPGMFGEIVISSNMKENKPFVPEDAIQKYGKETFVFLDLGNGKYKKQVIQIGEKALDGHFINRGVQAGDKIVGNGSFTLKSELLKSEFAEEE